VLQDATLTNTPCGVLVSAENLEHAGPGSYRAGAIALGNIEDNGINARGAPTDELVVTYVFGATGGGGNDKYAVRAQCWLCSLPDQNNPVWALQRLGNSPTNLLPEANVPGAWTSYQLYAKQGYLDWYGKTGQAAIALTANIDGVDIPQFEDQEYPCPHSYWRPMTVAVAGTGGQVRPSVCSGGVVSDLIASIFWGLAVGRFSKSTMVNPDNPPACGDFAGAAPGDCLSL